MSERNNHPEWENPYIVEADQVIINLIRSAKGIKSGPAEKPTEEAADGDN